MLVNPHLTGFIGDANGIVFITVSCFEDNTQVLEELWDGKI